MNEPKTDLAALAQPIKECILQYDLPPELKHGFEEWIDRIVEVHVECIKVHMDLIHLLRKFEKDDDRREEVASHLYGLLAPFNVFIQEQPNPLNGADKVWNHIQKFYQGLNEMLVKDTQQESERNRDGKEA